MGWFNFSKSKSTTSISNIQESGIESIINTTIDSSIKSHCSNVQSIDNSHISCPVKFAKQSCEVSVTGDSVIDVEVQQDMMQKAAAKLNGSAKSGIDGLDLDFASMKSSESKTIVNNVQRQFVRAVQNFEVICTRDASATNVQSIENITCEGDNAYIEFAAQKSKAEVASKCSVDSTQGNKVSQAMEADITAKSAAKISGLNFPDLGALAAIFFFVFFGGNLLSRNKRKRDQMRANQDMSGAMQWSAGFMALFGGLTVVFLIVGLYLRFSLSSDISGGRCDEIDTSDETERKSGELQSIPTVHLLSEKEDEVCTSAKDPAKCGKNVGYECGIVKCDKAEEDLNRYLNALTACEMLGDHGEVTNGCEVATLASKIISEKLEVGGCVRCPGGYLADETHGCSRYESKLYGRERLKHFALNNRTDSSVQMPCGPGDGDYCHTGSEDLKKEEKSACADEAYQKRHAVLARYLRICDQVEHYHTLKREEGYDVVSQCPVKVPDFLECWDAGGRYKCDYGDSKECKNDLSDCDDEEYKKDTFMSEGLASACDAMDKRMKRLEDVGFYLLLASAGSFLFTGVMYYVHKKYDKGRKSQAEANASASSWF